jgi:hypothetical protein
MSSDSTQHSANESANPAPARWPQMMTRKTAAEYCNVSIQAFIGEVAKARLPQPVMFGGRYHWHRPALDACLARICGDDQVPAWETEFWARGDTAGA